MTARRAAKGRKDIAKSTSVAKLTLGTTLYPILNKKNYGTATQPLQMGSQSLSLDARLHRRRASPPLSHQSGPS